MMRESVAPEAEALFVGLFGDLREKKLWIKETLLSDYTVEAGCTML
jgi:hypothetical protein